ncbi:MULTISPECIES: hypothetical protein [unclassified Apibacter]|uniref:hypothetical protein n=1 Tax=unclassified Apibacter TaxID=2630820 RepID=UPI00135D9444|nr:MULTISPECIES: hypothetical protein [unclassified Apibacter]MXP05586.1 hypothetical protein [Apibacter sp. B3546]MXP12532.1 hypothetical protein [Apibacter sp. B3239]
MKKKEKIEEKYFEDIFYPVKALWKGVYNIENVEKTKTYIESIREDYREVEYVVENENKKKYTWWDSIMVFTMYQTLTSVGLNYFKQNKKILNIDDISIEDFEKNFLENLEFEGNEEYLAKYKGLKSRVDKANF